MIFLTKEQLSEIHTATLREQGGIEGLRDENGLLSALVAAENRFYYEEAGIIDCAATYAFHLIKAHAFVDGNKRVGAISADVFLLMNAAKLFSDVDTLENVYLKVASGEMSREDLEKFYIENVEFL
jgi:death on curing protein